MASVPERNFNDDLDHSPSCTVDSSCDLNDCDSQPAENSLSGFSSNIASQPPFHQHHGNEPTAEMHSETKLGAHEFSGTQGSYQSAQQFAESDVNRSTGFDSLTQQQSGNEPIASQSSHPLSHKPQPSISNISQTAYSVSRDAFGNEFSASQIRNIPSNIHYSGEPSKIQDLSLQSFQHSVCRSEDIQSSHSQELQQSESELNMNKNVHPSSRPTIVFLNKSISNQDLHLLSRQPVEIENNEVETKGLHSLPQALKEDNPRKRPLPHSDSQQVFKRGLSEHAESQPSTSGTSCLIPDNSPAMGKFRNEKQTISSDQATNKVTSIESFDLSMLQRPYSNRSELITIFVYGPTEWTSRLLRTSAGGIPLSFSSPYSFAFERHITRCGILLNVAVWKIDDLIASLRFLNVSCLSSKSTIVFLLNVIDIQELLSTLHLQINLIRHDISQSVPIILVGGKVHMGNSDDELDSVIRNWLAVTTTGFRFKAQYDLSAYLECFVDSTEEVEAVMLTAIDVTLH